MGGGRHGDCRQRPGQDSSHSVPSTLGGLGGGRVHQLSSLVWSRGPCLAHLACYETGPGFPGPGCAASGQLLPGGRSQPSPLLDCVHPWGRSRTGPWVSSSPAKPCSSCQLPLDSTLDGPLPALHSHLTFPWPSRSRAGRRVLSMAFGEQGPLPGRQPHFGGFLRAPPRTQTQLH